MIYQTSPLGPSTQLYTVSSCDLSIINTDLFSELLLLLEWSLILEHDPYISHYTPLQDNLCKLMMLSNPDHPLWLFHSPCHSLLLQTPCIPQPHSVIILINLPPMLSPQRLLKCHKEIHKKQVFDDSFEMSAS